MMTCPELPTGPFTHCGFESWFVPFDPTDLVNVGGLLILFVVALVVGWGVSSLTSN